MVNGDRLIKTPWREVSAVERFLSIPPEISDSNFYFNRTKGFHCLRDLRPGGAPEAAGGRAGGGGQERCLAKSKGRPHPKVDPDTVSLLRRFYRKHNYKFYDLVGKDFGWPEE